MDELGRGRQEGRIARQEEERANERRRQEESRIDVVHVLYCMGCALLFDAIADSCVVTSLAAKIRNQFDRIGYEPTYSQRMSSTAFSFHLAL